MSRWERMFSRSSGMPKTSDTLAEAFAISSFASSLVVASCPFDFEIF